MATYLPTSEISLQAIVNAANSASTSTPSTKVYTPVIDVDASDNIYIVSYYDPTVIVKHNKYYENIVTSASFPEAIQCIYFGKGMPGPYTMPATSLIVFCLSKIYFIDNFSNIVGNSVNFNNYYIDFAASENKFFLSVNENTGKLLICTDRQHIISRYNYTVSPRTITAGISAYTTNPNTIRCITPVVKGYGFPSFGSRSGLDDWFYFIEQNATTGENIIKFINPNTFPIPTPITFPGAIGNIVNPSYSSYYHSINSMCCDSIGSIYLAVSYKSSSASTTILSIQILKIYFTLFGQVNTMVYAGANPLSANASTSVDGTGTAASFGTGKITITCRTGTPGAPTKTLHIYETNSTGTSYKLRSSEVPPSDSAAGTITTYLTDYLPDPSPPAPTPIPSGSYSLLSLGGSTYYNRAGTSFTVPVTPVNMNLFLDKTFTSPVAGPPPPAAAVVNAILSGFTPASDESASTITYNSSVNVTNITYSASNGSITNITVSFQTGPRTTYATAAILDKADSVSIPPRAITLYTFPGSTDPFPSGTSFTYTSGTSFSISAPTFTLSVVHLAGNNPAILQYNLEFNPTTHNLRQVSIIKDRP
jgi:hypothetical protein